MRSRSRSKQVRHGSGASDRIALSAARSSGRARGQSGGFCILSGHTIERPVWVRPNAGAACVGLVDRGVDRLAAHRRRPPRSAHRAGQSLIVHGFQATEPV